MLDNAQAQEVEVPFGIDEIFFSRTDGRGVIEAGNSVFQRVSGYPWERLINAPHKLIRHPEMPKGVFHLFWERIKEGQPTGAYVCNSSSDGRFYWVFAVVVPLGQGYLSVRIKPTSEMLHKVKGVYAQLRKEEAEGRTPSESAESLIQGLAEMGFPSYDSFQARALATELQHRELQLGGGGVNRSEALAAAEAADQIEIALNGMQSMFAEALRIALNLRIAASQLGELGRPVSAISDNYALLANDMVDWLNTRALDETVGFGGIARSVSESLFLLNAADLLSEMAEAFAKDDSKAEGDAAAERARLSGVATDYEGKAQTCQDRTMRQAATVDSHLAEMRKHVTALNSIRMLCRIEGATLRHTGVSLDEIGSQLDGFQDEIGRRLLKITSLGQQVQWATSRT
ncbi:PAS domain-containing protein [Marivita sp.]|uniref:PAS domain-containing protein n=1 Tax=Marivita sp. TaxID=2003365 RepID=UPI0025B8EABD|nr:PAS domain-containing protein [Marivita sp.]